MGRLMNSRGFRSNFAPSDSCGLLPEGASGKPIWFDFVPKLRADTPRYRDQTLSAAVTTEMARLTVASSAPPRIITNIPK